MTMSAHRWFQLHVGRLAPIALATVMILPFRIGWSQEQPAQHDHSQMQRDHSQMQHDHSQHGTQPAKKPAVEPKGKVPSKKKAPANHSGHTPPVGGKNSGPEHAGHAAPKGSVQKHAGHGAASTTTSEQHAGHDGAAHHGGMVGFLGPYGINREGSGTSWLPDTTPHEGIHGQYGDWMTMWHALFNGVYDHQGGPRGGQKTFLNGMVMGMAQRPLGDGTFGVRAMLSPDPFMGKSGYPLLFATGETADGRTHLVDRQHPHDLFMELATTYSYNLSKNSSVFLYAGLPGEPALGPTAFMHRIGGMDIPEAPITHHWLDSTHITFGVLTAGVVLDNWKMEASAFRGREPDEHRFDIESPSLDSFSARVTYNPIQQLSMQVSAGRLHSPEQLDPDVDENRVTASATYTQPFGDNNLWSTTFAWGRKMLQPGDTLDGFMLESALIFQKTYTLFLRAERVDENELFHDVPGFEGRVFTVNKVSVGGIYDIPLQPNVKLGVGALVSGYDFPSEIKPFYGHDPFSYMVFGRLKVQ
jgi:hypothetical protein